MSSRALRFAGVLVLFGFGAADDALAQAQNLEAGKSPSQLFAQTCNACHKSPRGLLKSVPPSSLPGFLRQHYTTSANMARSLASYLVSNGATDTRYGQTKGGAKGRDAGSSASQRAPGQFDSFGRRLRPPREVAKPPAEDATLGPETRRAKEAYEAAERERRREANPGNPAISERGVESRGAKGVVSRPKPHAVREAPATAGQEGDATLGPETRRAKEAYEAAERARRQEARPGDRPATRGIGVREPAAEVVKETPAEPSADNRKSEPGSEPNGDAAKVDAAKADAGRSDIKPSGEPSGGGSTAADKPAEESKPASQAQPESKSETGKPDGGTP